MKPAPSTFNQDPAYFQSLLDQTGLSRQEVARSLGVTTRAIDYWASGQRKFSYPVQFTLEALVAAMTGELVSDIPADAAAMRELGAPARRLT